MVAVIACNTHVVAQDTPVAPVPIEGPATPVAPVAPVAPPPTASPTNAPIVKNKMMMKDNEKPGMMGKV